MNNMEYFKGEKLIVSFLQITNYFELWILTLVCLKPSIPQRKHILNTNKNLNLKWETIHKTSNIRNYELFVQFVFKILQNIINSMYWSIVACCKYVIVELFTCWEQFKIWHWEFSLLWQHKHGIVAKFHFISIKDQFEINV
jgi:ABC-type glycerol-3-phosphate transport system permease component